MYIYVYTLIFFTLLAHYIEQWKIALWQWTVVFGVLVALYSNMQLCLELLWPYNNEQCV